MIQVALWGTLIEHIAFTVLVLAYNFYCYLRLRGWS